MQALLETLRQAAIFMVIGRMILHFFPGEKYDRYGKMMVALVVVSQLAVPLFSFLEEGWRQTFWERVGQLETDSEMFSGKLANLMEGEGALVENGVVLSVEECVRTQARQAGVEVKDVYIEEGVVVITVEKLSGGTPADTGAGQGAIEPVEIQKITWEQGGDESGDVAAKVGAGAQKGRPREDLAKIFADGLGLKAGRVQVIERQ